MSSPDAIDRFPASTDAFLAGGGELGRLIREKDWAATSLGAPESWPGSLKTVVRIMLTSRQPMWIGWGPELVYLYNDPYKSIIGGKHPRALGEPTSVVWREIWPSIGPLLNTALSGDGTFVESQLLIMERNGYPEETYYTFSYSPIPDDDGRPAGIVCANSDETRRVIGERQLALLRNVSAEAAQAKSVSAAIASCLRAMARDGKDLTFASVHLRERPGAPVETMRHPAPPGSAHLPAFDPFSGAWRGEEALGAGRPEVVDLPEGVDWPAGAWDRPPRQAMVLPVSSSEDVPQVLLVVGLNPYRLLDDAYRDFLALVGQQVATAVSNAQAYEHQLRRAEELAELDKAKTRFFANVSHELRTPLTLMVGPLADLLSGRDLPARLQEPLAMVHRNALRLSKLVNSLLEFSRIEAGRHESVFQPVDLSRLTADVASTFRSAMERAGLEFVVDCAPLPQPVYVDRDQWERVVLNLLSNALKFTLHGGVTVRIAAEGAAATLRVRDTGVGVPEHEIGRLFERFHRVQGTHGRTHEGTGIGLALVQELVRLHGGQVAVESAPARGTTFTVTLPFGSAHLDPAHVAAPAPDGTAPRQAASFLAEAMRWLPDTEAPTADAATEPDAATVLLGDSYQGALGASILVADDNADMRHYVGRLLGGPFDVRTVADGAEALQAARARRPALILSDVMMPRLDGFGLLEALRQDPALRTVPVILLSARAGEEARVEGLRAGADDYLVKPFSSRELLVRVAAAIQLDRMRRMNEERLRIALAGARMFTWDIDLSTSRVTLSDNADAVLGATLRETADGMRLVHPDDQARHEALLARVAADGSAEFTDEIRVLRGNDREVRWLEVRGRVMRDERGAAVRLGGVSFDITERKRLERALREQDHRKDEFLAMLAHELRNPMAPIRNAVEILNRQPAADERGGRAIRIIDRQLTQLNRMVDDLLDVSRITRGRIQLEHRPVDLSAVLGAAIEAAEPAIRDRGHALAVRSEQPLVVIGDAARLQQCVVNLLSNAAKYTDPGGHLAVDLHARGGEAVLTVKDDGTGIPPELLPEVFELFVQSTRTLDRAQGGLGIGLSVVRRLVQMHGGTVAARSDGVGQGSEFEIRLPLATQADQGEVSASPRQGPSRRVLIVDDNRDSAESLALLMEGEGHVPRVAFDAAQALGIAREWTPDAVLLDIGLPGIDGYEVARRLRALPGWEPVFLVALTGYGQAADRESARQAGFHAHLVKPAALQDLQRLLANLPP